MADMVQLPPKVLIKTTFHRQPYCSLSAPTPQYLKLFGSVAIWLFTVQVRILASLGNTQLGNAVA